MRKKGKFGITKLLKQWMLIRSWGEYNKTKGKHLKFVNNQKQNHHRKIEGKHINIRKNKHNNKETNPNKFQ